MKKTIRDFEIKNKRVIIRCDFNVPILNNDIIDETRIIASIPTIQYAIEQGAKVILFSHLGRVKSLEDKMKNTLRPVSERLENLLQKKVLFISETRGKLLEDAIENMKPGDVILVENTRYEDLEGNKESGNDPELGRYWASLGDIFINDAFGTLHRAHASNVGIAMNSSNSGIGLLVENELNQLSILEKPEHPFIVILGGSKVKDKIGVIERLITKADKILIGGAMAFTFLKARGYSIGKSLLDEENLDFCKKTLNNYDNKIILPKDVIVSPSLQEDTVVRTVSIQNITPLDMGLDIGPSTIKLFQESISDAKTIFWNGPLGAYEYENYRQGTSQILENVTKSDTKVILGGGDIVAAATQFGYQDKVTYCSTGGGATLEYLEGKILPGLENIQERS